MNPGSVSSADDAPPPMRSSASYTTTRRPACASATAADSPFGPAPTTIASGDPAMALLYGGDRHDARAARLLALPLAVRARPRDHVPGRVSRHAQPVSAAGRRARPDARWSLPAQRALPIHPERLPLGLE